MQPLTKGQVRPILNAVGVILETAEKLSCKVHEVCSEADVQKEIDRHLGSIAEQCSVISTTLTKIIAD